MFILVDLAWAETPRDLVAPLGTDRLADIEELRFTFVVEREGKEPRKRSWTWRPGDGLVTRRTADGELTFHAGAPTNDAEKEADAQFVNDGFWLIPQLHVRWAGPELTLVDHGPAALPVGEGTARRVEAIYAPTSGGYTPGDAYDLYLDDRGRIVAWVYREGGAPEPTLANTFADYQVVGPLSIATDHRSADGAFRLRFEDLDVTLAPGAATVGRPGAEPVVEIGPAGCRLRGVDLPMTQRPPATPAASTDAVFDLSFEARVGARREPLRVAPSALVANPPGLAAEIGLDRCDVAAAGTDVVRAALAGADRDERALLVTLGMGAWMPASAPPAVRRRVTDAAKACVDDGTCDPLAVAATAR